MARRRRSKQQQNRPLVVVQAPVPSKRQQQQSAQQTAQPARRRNRRRRGMRMASGGAQQCVLDLAKSMLRPWEASACIPDATRYLTPFTLKQTGTLTTGTGGSAYGIFTALQPDAFTYTDSGSTTDKVTIGTNWANASAITNLVNTYNAYRVVSGGIRVWYTGSTLNDQGILIVGQNASQYTLNLCNAQTSTGMANGSSIFKIGALREGATITWRPEDIAEMSTLFDVDGTANAASAVTNTGYLFACVFGASTNGASSVQYEITVNFEGQFGTQSYIPGGINPDEGPAVGGWYEAVGNIIKQVPAYAKPVADIGRAAYGVYQAVNGAPSQQLNLAARRLNRIEF